MISLVKARREQLVASLREAAEMLEAEVTTRAARHAAAARLRALEVMEEAPPASVSLGTVSLGRFLRRSVRRRRGEER